MSHLGRAVTAKQVLRAPVRAASLSARPCSHEPAGPSATQNSRSMGHEVRNLMLHRRQAPTMCAAQCMHGQKLISIPSGPSPKQNWCSGMSITS